MVDIFILVLMAWALFSGWRRGFIKELVSTGGTLVGLLVAATCYSAFSETLAVNGSESNMITSVVAFLILWIAVPIALGFAATVLTKALKGMKLGVPNSLLGALVSGVKYLLLISCVLNAMEALGIMNEEKAQASSLYAPVTASVRYLFPEDTTRVDTSAPRAEQGDTIWVDMTQKKGDKQKK